jgi:hypothetical protein
MENGLFLEYRGPQRAGKRIWKKSGNDDPRLTSARKPFIFKGLRVCYICHSVFATLLQYAFLKKCFATDGIVPGGFETMRPL